MLRVRQPQLSTPAAGGFTLSADGATYTYSGNDANLQFNRRFAPLGATYIYSGNDANILFNRLVGADGNVYSYAGNNADLTYTPIGGFTLGADGATYTYSGNDANLLFSRLLFADGGTYTYAGNNANTLFNRLVGADGGVYSYAGNNANTLFNRRVGSDGGTFAYNGNNANLLFGYSLLADGGSYTYSGNNADLTYTPAGSCPSVAQIWAYQLVPGVTAGQMLTDIWQASAPVSSIASGILDASNVESNLTVRQALKLIAAATAGKISGAGGSTITIRNAVADTDNRIVATVDGNGNRTAITYDLS